MNLPDPKALKELAEACRKAGIKTLKCDGFEFTLGDAPEKQRRNRKHRAPATTTDPSSEDALNEEELLFWSVNDTFKNEAES